MAKQPSRADRWREAVDKAKTVLSEIEAKAEELTQAMGELQEVQEEYEGWKDNLPDSLSDSPVGEKLSAVVDLDLDVELDLQEISGVLDEAEGIDLPLGWGKD